MRIAAFFMFVCIGLISCQNDAKQIGESDEKAKAILEKEKALKSLPYTVEYAAGTDEMTLIETDGNVENLSSPEVVGLLNKKYQAIQLNMLESKGDTVFLQIKDATSLTQEMGSAGAQAYLAELTFSFTEVEGINVVDVRFEEGDHAMPGSYKREDFSEFKVIKQK